MCAEVWSSGSWEGVAPPMPLLTHWCSLQPAVCGLWSAAALRRLGSAAAVRQPGATLHSTPRPNPRVSCTGEEAASRGSCPVDRQRSFQWSSAGEPLSPRRWNRKLWWNFFPASCYFPTRCSLRQVRSLLYLKASSMLSAQFPVKYHDFSMMTFSSARKLAGYKTKCGVNFRFIEAFIREVGWFLRWFVKLSPPLIHHVVSSKATELPQLLVWWSFTHGAVYRKQRPSTALSSGDDEEWSGHGLRDWWMNGWGGVWLSPDSSCRLLHRYGVGIWTLLSGYHLSLDLWGQGHRGWLWWTEAEAQTPSLALVTWS